MENKPAGKVWTCMTCGAMNIQRDGVCAICGTNKDNRRTHTERPEHTENDEHAAYTADAMHAVKVKSGSDII